MKIQLDILGSRTYDLPPIEREFSELSVQEFMDRVQEFWHRYEKTSQLNDENEFAPMYFMQLLAYYPVSLCKRGMSDTLKLLIAMSYYCSKPEEHEKEPIWNGFSYEDLSLIFVRSKASIHAAIRDNTVKAKDLLITNDLRKEAREIALSRMIEEEKAKLREENEQMLKQMAKQTNERALTLEEGI